jgi:hypothetical protein
MVQIGDTVTFVDAVGKEYPALVTQVWGHVVGQGEPGTNLIVVSDDESRSDTYGRQVIRHTSVVHQASQPAHGMFWK